MKNITVKDIAEKAGVSPSTVSRALNNRSKVAPELRRRIVELARKMDYRPPAGSRSRTVAVILPAKAHCDMGIYERTLLNRIIQHESVERDYRIMLLSADDFSIIEEQTTVGVLSFDYLQRLADRLPKLKNLPMVCVNDYGKRLDNIYSVRSNDRQGIRLALAHLWELGHRRIGLLQDAEGGRTLCSDIREESYLEWMTEMGGTVSVSYVDSLSNHAEAVGRLLQQQVTAILAAGEAFTLWLYRLLELYGRRIPEDISLVTWEAPEISEFMSPRTTTIAQDFPRIVAAAFDLLEEQIEGRQPAGDIVVDNKFLLRESTARIS